MNASLYLRRIGRSSVLSQLLLLGLILVVRVQSTTADALDNWQWRGATPNRGNPWNGVSFANGMFFVHGLDIFMTSTDAANWTIRSSPDLYDIGDVAFGNGIFVAVGMANTLDKDGTRPHVCTSTDGASWKIQEPPFEWGLFQAIAFGNGIFVVTAFASNTNSPTQVTSIFTSSDGVHWTTQAFPDLPRLEDIVYANGKFIAVGSFFEGSIVLTSADGVVWRRENPPALRSITSVTAGNGIYVAAGAGIAVSADLTNWTSIELNGSIDSLAYGQETFVAVGAGGLIRRAVDGINWETVVSPTRNSFSGVAFGNGSFVAVGWGTLFTSVDGIIWVAQANSAIPPIFADVAYGNGLFAAVGEKGTIAISDDGAQWKPVPVATRSLLRNVITAQNSFFVAGSDPGTLLRSADGTNWNSQDFGKTNLAEIAYGNETFVLLTTDGFALSSKDLLSWQTARLGHPSWPWSLAFGNDTFVAVNYYFGSVLTSHDGVNWSDQGTPAGDPSPNLYAIGYGDGRFVIAGRNTILVSQDASAWARVNVPWFFPVRVRHAAGTFMVVGDRGTLLTSSNGLDWKSRSAGTVIDLAGVAYGRNSFVTVGEFGAILQSAPFADVRFGPGTVLPDRSFRTTLAGPVGWNYQVQASSDLSSWTALTNFVGTNPSTELIDPNTSKLTKKFYRSVTSSPSVQ